MGSMFSMFSINKEPELKEETVKIYIKKETKTKTKNPLLVPILQQPTN